MLGAHCSLWKMIQTTESFFFRQGFSGAPAAAERIEEKQQFPLLTCSLPEQGEGGGGKDFPHMR